MPCKYISPSDVDVAQWPSALMPDLSPSTGVSCYEPDMYMAIAT